ncbi:MAG: CorA family divalent cation transporter, partial [Nitrosopumilaceae archaeon]|nr:CorA family divalent cation transporter [Nitrosopumilaceae archaeon]
KVLAMLTIIFTLTIPATVIGTFYGMNIPLPGGINDQSALLCGQYTVFIIIILASIIPSATMFAYFKKVGWISP